MHSNQASSLDERSIYKRTKGDSVAKTYSQQLSFSNPILSISRRRRK